MKIPLDSSNYEGHFKNKLNESAIRRNVLTIFEIFVSTFRRKKTFTKIEILEFSSKHTPNNLLLLDVDTGEFRPRGDKTFFMLNLNEHEIFPAHKC